MDDCILYLITCDIDDIHNETNILVSYITNQYMELWDDINLGDFVENTITRNKFIVIKSPTLKIAQNNLTLKQLYENKYIISSFYSITQYKLNYFDNIHINRAYSENKYYNVENYYKQPIYLDIDKLQLINNLSSNNLYHYTITKFSQLFNNKFTIDYLYIILAYKNVEYMFISKYSNEYHHYSMINEKIKFIRQFKTYNNMYFLENNIDDDDIMTIADTEKIQTKNIIYIIGTKIVY
jgi:hypothetical protein